MTAEIVTELRKLADFIDADTYDECWEVKETARGKLLRAASIRLSELERENARMRGYVERILKELEMHINWKPTKVAVEVAIAFEIAREALAGSGEK
jgi:hypothetical protein